MNRIYSTAASAFLFFIITSCSYEDLNDSFVPKEESEFAKGYLLKLREGDFEYVKSFLSPELILQADDDTLSKLTAQFRAGDLISANIVGYQVNITNSQWQGNFTFEFEFESGWNIANTVLRKSESGYEVVGLHVYQTEASQKEINAFNLSSKHPLQYVVLFFAVAVPIFILFTLIFCIRTPIPSNKWLWIIFVIFGFGAFQINWTNGAFAVQLLSIHLFGASATAASPSAPWVISASVPIGAIIFWFKRRKFILAAIEARSEEANNEIEPPTNTPKE